MEVGMGDGGERVNVTETEQLSGKESPFNLQELRGQEEYGQ